MPIRLPVLVLGICTVASPCVGQEFALATVSSRPDAVSGGTALVRLTAPAAAKWTSHLDGQDVTASFRDRLALLTGLAVGKNVLTVRANGRVVASLELVNHPRSGPIFSGPHQTPFICQTEANGLGPPLDADCHAKTIVQYYYKSSQPSGTPSGTMTAGFKPYPADGSPPNDVARTVTSAGQEVDYVVRREVGVINRAVYEIQMLHRPGDPLPTPWTGPTGAWNGRLAYQFLWGCATGFRQAVLNDSLGAVQEPLVGKGYAIATSTLNAFLNDCNDRISAETLSMVKEHFIEQFGPPAHTIGWGGSGGAMQVYMISQNYPGLLDGVVAMASFPDVGTFVPFTTDCQLLARAFAASRHVWTDAEKTAVFGFASWGLCAGIVAAGALPLADPGACNPVVPRDLVYDPARNPKGARCDIYGNAVNVFGRDPKTGQARRPLDNVGVQYGLRAFNRGAIGAEEFVELNERIGGLDGDGKVVAGRTEADEESLRLAYERGILVTGGGGLADVPILDWRPYSDDLGAQDGHAKYLTFVVRARLMAANGHPDNQVVLVDSREAWFGWRRHFWEPIGRLVPLMDRWLDAIAAERGDGSRSAKVVRAKPNDLADSCTLVDGTRIVEPASYDGPGRCNRHYPSYANPRIVAGGPLADDVLKCALKPIIVSDYARPLSEDQLRRLRAAFPTGVCDYSKPGVRQAVTRATWLRF